MVDVEIKRGYEVLPDNNVRFGIRITNISDFAISDVEVTLDYPKSLFDLEGNRIQNLGNIPPERTHTAEFILKPLGCVHKVNIDALLSYRDAKWNRQRVDLHPKEVHCVCPFLKSKAMPRVEFLKLSNAGHSAETGVNFKSVSVERLVSYFVQTCKSRHHKVDDYSVDGGRMLYLASESIGEEAYYLLTVLIKEDDELTQVMLRAVSDKPHGLNGFLNETVAELRHVVSTVQSAQEIGIIKKEQVINIIDSVVQKTSFGGAGGGASVNIRDSIVQRTEFDAGDDRRGEEEQFEKVKRKAQERAERKKLEERERTEADAARKENEQQKAREQETLILKQRDEQQKSKPKSRKNAFMFAIILGVLLVGFVLFTLGSDSNTGDTMENIVKEGDYVKVDYIGELEDGTIFDTSIENAAIEGEVHNRNREYEPLGFTVGAGQMIAGFDGGVVGMAVGEEKTLTLPPEEAYGAYREELVQTISLEELTSVGIFPTVGDKLNTPQGIVAVTDVTDTEVKLDYNHNLAGKTLTFKVTIVSIGQE